MSVNDNMFKSLQDAGFTGALSDMLYQWLQTFAPEGINQFELYNDDGFFAGNLDNANFNKGIYRRANDFVIAICY